MWYGRWILDLGTGKYPRSTKQNLEGRVPSEALFCCPAFLAGAESHGEVQVWFWVDIWQSLVVDLSLWVDLLLDIWQCAMYRPRNFMLKESRTTDRLALLENLLMVHINTLQRVGSEELIQLTSRIQTHFTVENAADKSVIGFLDNCGMERIFFFIIFFLYFFKYLNFF